MKKITRWSPDTCGCVIDYEWDTDVPAEERVHTTVHTVQCEHHKGVSHKECHAFVLAENQKKNKVVNLIAAATGVEAHTVSFKFDSKRKLKIVLEKTLAKQELTKALSDAGHTDVEVTADG